MLAPADQIARLRLTRSETIGPVTYFQLLARFGSAQAALDAIPDLAARGGGRAPRLASSADAEREFEQVARLGARHLFVGEGLYPALLAELDAPPPALTVKGDLSLLARQAVAIVGARNASAAASRFARQLAHSLGAAGIAIVSGLARGVDSAAHDGSLETGTIAVIAGAVWLVAVVLTRISSVGGIAAAISAPIVAAIFGRIDFAILFLGFTLLIVWKHRANIGRLVAGTEPKLGKAA